MPTRTRTRAATQQHRAAVEQAILDATEVLLETRPFRDLTVEDVMEVAGLGRTAFYRYFPDLESVVLCHMAGISDELFVASRDWLVADDPDAQLEDSGLRIAAVYRDHGRVMEAFSHAAGAGPDVHQAWQAVLDSLIEPGVAHLEVLVEQGRAECVRPGETIRALSLLIDRYLLEIYGRSNRSTSPGPSECSHRSGGGRCDCAEGRGLRRSRRDGSAGSAEERHLRAQLQLEVSGRRTGDVDGSGGRADVHAGEPGEERVVVTEGDSSGLEQLHLLEHELRGRSLEGLAVDVGAAAE